MKDQATRDREALGEYVRTMLQQGSKSKPTAEAEKHIMNIMANFWNHALAYARQNQSDENASGNKTEPPVMSDEVRELVEAVREFLSYEHAHNAIFENTEKSEARLRAAFWAFEAATKGEK